MECLLKDLMELIIEALHNHEQIKWKIKAPSAKIQI